ncbi:MAG: septum formation inhibitor Maf [Candidatus Levybacteria bacterium]|nr:septum formation inhibitor Maf [Candidatus Levybacteria bacterium]
MKQLILASESARRKQLLEKMGIPYKVVPSNVEERLNARLKPKAQAIALSRQKAEAVAAKYKNAIVLAADTFVVLNDKIIGKPISEIDAKRMLRKLSGKPHNVITGFTIVDSATKKSVSNAVETTVYMKKISEKEMDSYIKTGEPMDKAGAYAVQERGALFVKRIDGDFFNVVGLPIFAVSQALRKFGIYFL